MKWSLDGLLSEMYLASANQMAASAELACAIQTIVYSNGFNVTWPPWMLVVSNWPKHKKVSPLKLLGQMGQYLTGTIFARSFLN